MKYVKNTLILKYLHKYLLTPEGSVNQVTKGGVSLDPS